MEFYKNLPTDHLLKYLYDEHQQILKYLTLLESEVNLHDDKTAGESATPDVKKLLLIADNLLNSEPHHKREEDILFPEMEKEGISGPTMVMRTEHEGFREYKHNLKKLLLENLQTEHPDNIAKIQYTAVGLVGYLRSHIMKENNILYPMAYQTLTDPELWNKMKLDSDKLIGPCEFQEIS